MKLQTKRARLSTGMKKLASTAVLLGLLACPAAQAGVLMQGFYKNAAENPCGLPLGMNAALPFRRQDIRALRNLAGCGTIDV